MSIFTEQEAKAILDKVIALSKADECTATLAGSVDGNIRFALNNVSTSGIVSNAELAVQVAFGKRVGTASINEFDDASLERVVRRAEDLAKLAPENPEFMPAIGKQDYKPSPTFSASTAAIDPDFRAKVAADSIAPCRGHGLIAAGGGLPRSPARPIRRRPPVSRIPDDMWILGSALRAFRAARGPRMMVEGARGPRMTVEGARGLG